VGKRPDALFVAGDAFFTSCAAQFAIDGGEQNSGD
jgi:hypothetical protein